MQHCRGTTSGRARFSVCSAWRITRIRSGGFAGTPDMPDVDAGRLFGRFGAILGQFGAIFCRRGAVGRRARRSRSGSSNFRRAPGGVAVGAGSRLPMGLEDVSPTAGGGHLAALRWAREHGCPWNKRLCEMAARDHPRLRHGRGRNHRTNAAHYTYTDTAATTNVLGPQLFRGGVWEQQRLAGPNCVLKAVPPAAIPLHASMMLSVELERGLVKGQEQFTH